MTQLSYRRHRFPPRHAIWLYLRFTLSYRNVEELLAERGLSPCLSRNLDQQPKLWLC
jgi:transposase-like protein